MADDLVTLSVNDAADVVAEGIEAAVAPLIQQLKTLEARIAELEARPVKYAGVYTEGRTYRAGDLVTHGGSLWHANEATTIRPGTPDAATAWTLAVKKGKDGRDGRDGRDFRPSKEGAKP